MTSDHPYRENLVRKGDYPNLKDATQADWLQWVDSKFPFSPEHHQRLLRRHVSPDPGSELELSDLRGMPDRLQAADWARLWFYLGTRDWERAFRANKQFKRAQEAREKQYADQRFLEQQKPKRKTGGCNPGEF